MKIAPHSIRFRLRSCAVLVLSCLLLTVGSASAEEIDKAIYREDFPAGGTGMPPGWQVAFTGAKAPTVTIATEPGAATTTHSARDGYLTIRPSSMPDGVDTYQHF
jgi:hypothetical protein